MTRIVSLAADQYIELIYENYLIFPYNRVEILNLSKVIFISMELVRVSWNYLSHIKELMPAYTDYVSITEFFENI